MITPSSFLKSLSSSKKASSKKSATTALKVDLRPPAPQEPLPLPGDLKKRLNGLRQRYQLVGIIIGFAMLISAVSLLFLFQGLSDWWFDLPWFARAGFLLVDLVVLGWIYRRKLDGALRKRLDLAQTAMLVEKKWPQLKQSVIAAVELTEGKPYSTRGSQQLVGVMLQQTNTRTLNLNFNEVVPVRMLYRWLLIGSTAFLGTAAIAVAAWPSSAALIERIFLLNVPLPTKTIVVAITRDLIVPVGSDVEISARAQGIIPSNGRVTITYAGSTAQDSPVTPLPDKRDTFSFTLHNVQTAFTYSFHLNDGHGPEFNVSAKVPPILTGLECEQDYPDYTGLPPRKLAPTELSLLVGSHLKLRATSADPLRSATVVLQGVPEPIKASLDPSGTHLEAVIPIPAKDLTGFSIHLLDQANVASTNETIYPIVLVPDNPPTSKILEPQDDHETITLRAKPVIVFEAGDDFGLTDLTINYQLIPPMIAGAKDSPPPSEIQHIPVKIQNSSLGTRYEYTLDVSAQTPAWQEGDTINYWIEAKDNNTSTGPGLTKTDHKQFSIVSIEAKQTELLERLKQNAAGIGSLSDTQQKITNDVGETIPKK
jgi:hypothetical protein